jgi:hypothetical protein
MACCYFPLIEAVESWLGKSVCRRETGDYKGQDDGKFHGSNRPRER